MQTIAVMSQKGGTGKTTVAAHLGVSAETAGHRCILMDMDPQKSALAWGRLRDGPGPVINEARAGTLYFARQAAEKLAIGLMVIDTPPSCDKDTLEAVRGADLCVIVVRPSFFDIEAAKGSVEIVRSLDRPALFVLNQTPAGQAAAVKAAVEELSRYRIPISPVRLHSRPAYQIAAGKGRTVQEIAPSSAAAVEAEALWRVVKDSLAMGDRRRQAAPMLRAITA